MAGVAKPIDIVVWGATGTVGKLVAEHVAQNYQGRVKWALAGRNKEKLEAVRRHITKLNPACNDVPIMLGDIQDQASIDEIAQQCKVVIATAGPFARHGTAVVDACLRTGADYCDCTGEMVWTRRMADKYHDTAKEKNLRIVHCCGFDSIPSDLGTLLVVDHLNKLGKKVAAVTTLFGKMSGTVSGGTIASLMNQFTETSADQKGVAHPYAFNPPSDRQGPDTGDQLFAKYHKDQQKWSFPFIMSPVNTRVVRRSAALQRGAYGDKFSYKEAMSAGGLVSALALTSLMGVFAAAIVIPPLRFLLKKVLPAPGQGPSKQVQESGYWKAVVTGRSQAGPNGGSTLVKAQLADPSRDPGYWSTARMVLESGLCLAEQKDQARMMGLQTGGVLTPASAMGMLLIDRLRKAGYQFDITDENTGS